jgi:hypothetical protein
MDGMASVLVKSLGEPPNCVDLGMPLRLPNAGAETRSTQIEDYDSRTRCLVWAGSAMAGVDVDGWHVQILNTCTFLAHSFVSALE